jgi:hypothetical protein
MDEIWQRGAVGIAGLIRQRKVSSVEVVEAFSSASKRSTRSSTRVGGWRRPPL